MDQYKIGNTKSQEKMKLLNKKIYNEDICCTLMTSPNSFYAGIVPMNLDQYKLRDCKSGRVKILNDKHIHDDDITGTLMRSSQNGQFTHTGIVPYKQDYRYITPLEMKRLQSFPDNFKLPEGKCLDSYTKLFGNSITVNVVKEIMRNILK